MTSLNNIINDSSYRKREPEVLIELPDPKLINDNCTIIMNGHHNYGMSEEKESYTVEETKIEKPYLNHTDTEHPDKRDNSMVHSNSMEHSNSNAFPLKESFAAASSADEDSDVGVEPESSTLLLHDQEQTELSPKCSKNKTKLPNFKSSPSRKQTSQDPHSHIQHRPLGLPQDTTPDHIFHVKPYWPFSSLPCFLFGIFTLLLVVACLVVGLYFAMAPGCRGTRQWWQGAVFYEVFPASFQDTDGDGFGDMKGLVERLDYIQNLSVDIVRLSSIFSALDYPLEYEHVIDFANIDPHLGRIEDFQEVVKEIHRRGMHVVLDMNPTVTSDQHTWAAHWLLHRPGPFQHFYINVTDAEGEEPPLQPNPDYTDRTWTPPHRTFGSHLFLNWSNPLLQLEMSSILEMWTAQGVDGFYMKHLQNLHVANTDHIALALRQWRQVLDKYSTNSTRKLLMVSHLDMEFLQTVMDPLTFTEIPNFVDVVDAGLSLARKDNESVSTLTLIQEVKDVQKFWSQFPFPPPIVWHMGSVETMRLGSRVGDQNNMAAMFLLAVLPGSFSILYGDEIGLLDSYDSVTLEVYRGGQLAPMQWTSGPQANFTTDDNSEPWLPVNQNYVTRNVDAKSQQTQLFKKLTEMKRSEEALLPPISSDSRAALMHSLVIRFSSPFENDPREYEWHHDPCGLIVARIVSGNIVLVANLGSQPLGFKDDTKCRKVDVDGSTSSNVASLMEKQLEVLISTNSSTEKLVEFSQILLQPGDAIIGKFDS